MRKCIVLLSICIILLSLQTAYLNKRINDLIESTQAQAEDLEIKVEDLKSNVDDRLNEIVDKYDQKIEDVDNDVQSLRSVVRNTNHALIRLTHRVDDIVEASNRQDDEEDAEFIGSSSESSQQASYEARDGMEFFGTWDISAYEWTEPQSPCANGNYPTVMYSAACNYLPFGTRIYIEGVGDFVIEDRIGVDNRIDIFLGDVESCKQFGVQSHNVYIYN